MSDIAKASWDVLESGESSFICKLVIIVIELSYFLVSNCRIPGPIVSPRRHSLKNESKYNRSCCYANKWAGYSAI